ncbi:Hypothetical predicted protein [Xyrichtys novacula]|uniref:Uncharacterized protein n=1 Tax=Xyrichtys novacula TaxID=13765 RepID=A0AAV1FPY5_XYRNO|nr:Hypothetical predicted protein [Xyrichtys novacula]
MIRKGTSCLSQQNRSEPGESNRAGEGRSLISTRFDFSLLNISSPQLSRRQQQNKHSVTKKTSKKTSMKISMKTSKKTSMKSSMKSDLCQDPPV